jgi:MFS superfamily sulfate permease-like transporter
MKENKSQDSGFLFTLNEFSGSLGDLGLFLPLVIAISIETHMNFGIILIAAGAMNIVTGLIFRQPIPVQPMKAMAAVAITEGMLRDELVAAGIIMGVILFLLSVTGMIDKFTKIIPKPIVRGIQFGAGAKLMLKALDWVQGLPAVDGFDSVLIAVIISTILFFFSSKKFPALVVIFILGFIVIRWTHPAEFNSIEFELPRPEFFLPQVEYWKEGLLKGVLPQLPLTILNSVVAVCALSADYFPGRGIPPRKMAMSVGLMNLVAVPLGGIPMCHGAGGLAAQYSFGARTGASVVMLGVLKILVGLLFGTSIVWLLQVYPTSIFAPMLLYAGYQLSRAARDMTKWNEFAVVLITTVFILWLNTWIGFLAGCVAFIILIPVVRRGKFE